MRFKVIADAERRIIGTMVEGATTPDGDQAAIRPAHPDHSLHSLEVPDSYRELSPKELHQRLEEQLKSDD